MDERERIREKINAVDARILEALSERVHLAKEIGQYKKKAGLSIVDAARETIVLRKIGEEATRRNLPREKVEAVYREIIRLCRSVQMEQLRVAFLGPRGTFCEQAAREHFLDDNAVFEERPSITDVFRSVTVKEVDRGVVPVENSSEGPVVPTLDLLGESALKICGEVITRVRHNLIARPDAELDDVREVASHPQALAQCQRYLDENLPSASLLETRSTADAVRLASERTGVAAIGTELAAQIYGMKVLASGIEDNHENHTRFFILSWDDHEPTGNDRTSILFSVKHRPGSLCEALSAFSSRGINLTKIESRPARRGPWEYVFFCDFEGHREDAKIKEALEELRTKATELKILGSYPIAR
jgi:chorismate mutase/prephenate dehydratase